MTAELIAQVKLHSTLYRGCERCGGTLHLERDVDSLVDQDAYEYVCLQCGGHSTPAAVMRGVREREATGIALS
jgi:hypothetical protein